MMLRFPFTLMFLLTMVVANYLAGTLTGALPHNILTEWGIGHETIVNAEFYRLITGTFLSHDIDMFLRQMGFVALVVGYVEWVFGSLVTAGLFFAIDIVGTVILLGLLAWLRPFLPDTNVYDVGMSIGGFGLLGVVISRWHWKWISIVAVLAAIVVKSQFEPDFLADVGHVLALFLGFALGLIMLRSTLPEGEAEDYVQ